MANTTSTAGIAGDVPATHREVHLIARPQEREALTEDHFRIVEVPVPVPGPGQVLVRNRLTSVTAAMRTLMNDDDTLPLPPYQPGEPLWAPAVGEVVAAAEGAPPGVAAGSEASAGLRPGDLVQHSSGWREYAAVDIAKARPIDPGVLPDPAAHLSQAFTAWLGVVRGAEVRDGDTVFVTGAAGGVGSLAGQFARLHGARLVIGSTGSKQKADYLTERLGYDAVVLRDGWPIEDQLRRVAPDGIDAVFDNVGGGQLEAALAVVRPLARVALIGSLSTQVGGGRFTTPTAIDTSALISRSVTLRGLSGVHHHEGLPEANAEFGRALREGTIVFPHTKLSGIAQAPRALAELLEGRHIGAVLVEL